MQRNAAAPEIILSRELTETLIKICLEALPHKAYGLIGGPSIFLPKSFYPCCTNLRNTPEWKEIFESYGDFYKNPDLGFVIAPDEVHQAMKAMEKRSETFIGVYHSHRYLPAEPSEIDIGLSSDADIFSYIISVADPLEPRLGIFRIDDRRYQRIMIHEGTSHAKS
jgi:proteasome lid subunit RPN8/RPN11